MNEHLLPTLPRTLTPGPLRLLAWLAIASIVASTVFSIIGVTVTLPMLEAAGGAVDESAGEGPMATSDGVLSVIAVVSMIGLVLWACAAGFFIAWLYRARVNLEQAGIVGFSRSRGWLIGAWFIPFVNLVMPYRIVVEVAEASDHRSRWWRPAEEVASGRRLLIGWWLTWVGALVVDRIGSANSTKIVELAVTEEELAAALPTVVAAAVVTAALFIAAAVQVTLLILRVTRHQHDWTTADAARAAGASPQPAAQP